MPVNVQQPVFALNAWTRRLTNLRSQFQSTIEYTQGVSHGLTVSHLPFGNECLVQVSEGGKSN